MTLDDLLRDGKPDAAAVIATALMQALKHLKHQFAILFFDSDSVVLDGKRPLMVISLGANVDVRRMPAVKFQRISN